jgi:hypothetical protein
MENKIINFKKYNLFLDDIREPTECLTYSSEPRYGTCNWIVVRSHAEFVQLVIDKYNNGEFPELVSFDHDLAHEHYDQSMYQEVDSYNEKIANFREETGNETAKWFVQFCIDKNIKLPECLIHSMNPYGKEKIKQTLKDYDRYISKFNR